jgi:hypothetical protein
MFPMRALLVAAAALVIAAPLHAVQRPLPASMTCPATLSVAGSTYAATLTEKDTLIYSPGDTYYVACVWGLGDKKISFSVTWAETTKFLWRDCGRQYNDGFNYASRTKRASARLGISEGLNTPLGQVQQQAVLTILERFLDAAEVRAARCKAAPPPTPAHATLQKWAVSYTHAVVRSGHVSVVSFQGGGTFRLSAAKKPTGATGTFRLVQFIPGLGKKVGFDMQVTGAASYRRSGSVERITLRVRVTQLDTGNPNCLEHDTGTITLVDGYGVSDDEVTIAGICGLNGTSFEPKVTIR